MSYREETVKIPDFELTLKIWNANSIKPILCLPGKMDNAASFDFLAPLLPDKQLDKPVGLIRAIQGVPYPQEIFTSIAQCFRDKFKS